MKLLKLLTCVCFLFCSIGDIKAQILPGPSRNVYLEVLSSAGQLDGGGTVIFPLKAIRFNTAQDTLIVEVYDQPDVRFPFASVWGYEIYRNKADTVELYRLSAAFKKSPRRRAAVIYRHDGFVIYSETYDLTMRNWGPVEAHALSFSRFLYSDIHPLDYNDILFVYEDANPRFAELVRREMRRWSSFRTVNEKTNRLIITELYEQSLSDHKQQVISDTLRHSKANGN